MRALWLGFVGLLAGCGPLTAPVWCKAGGVDADGDTWPTEWSCKVAIEAADAQDFVEYASVPAVDCDDGDEAVFPTAPDGGENSSDCDGEDNDCDRLTDEDADVAVWYADADGDGYGDADAKKMLSVCDDTTGYVLKADDCEDGDDNPNVNPGAVDAVCSDGVDANCDGREACALEGEVALADLIAVGAAWQVPGASVAVLSGGQVVVGDPESDTVTIYDGATGAELTSNTGSTGSRFGAAVAVGDFDGYGEEDLAVGAPGESRDDAGEVAVFLGADLSSSPVVIASPDAAFGLGEALAKLTQSGSDGLVAELSFPGPDENGAKYVYLLADPMVAATDGVSSYDSVGSYTIVTSWPLTLATSPDGSALAVGFSGGSSTGAEVYDLDATLTVQFTTTATDDLLGASVALLGVAGGSTADLLVGAPGAGKVYGKSDPNSGDSPYGTGDADLTWTGPSEVSFGAGLGLPGDLNGDGDSDLAIGGENTVWIFAGPQSETESTAANAYATITGFSGPVRTILSDADVNGDGFADLLASDGTSVTVLFGGAAPAVQP